VSHTVATCPVCRCCHTVDGECLGECGTNGHRATEGKRGKLAIPNEGGCYFVDLYLYPELYKEHQ
jgi:hypothetical protein